MVAVVTSCNSIVTWLVPIRRTLVVLSSRVVLQEAEEELVDLLRELLLHEMATLRDEGDLQVRREAVHHAAPHGGLKPWQLEGVVIHSFSPITMNTGTSNLASNWVAILSIDQYGILIGYSKPDFL